MENPGTRNQGTLSPAPKSMSKPLVVTLDISGIAFDPH